VSFERLLGQARLVAALWEAIRADRLAHALLVVGPPGSGKRTLARELAKALLCARAEGDACDECRDCRLVEHGNHPDLNLFARDAAHSNVHIETARALQDALALKPFQARRKVAVLEEANLLNEAAANSLLKTLEEPPGDAVILLLTTTLADVLPTIRSRCQVLRMRPLSTAVVAEVLEREHGLAADQAAYAAAMSGGTLGRALELSRPDWYDMKRWVVEALAGLRRETVFTLSDEMAARAKRLGKTPAAYREALCRTLEFAAAFYRDAVAAGVVPPVHADQADLLPRGREDRAARCVERLIDAQDAIAANANPGLVLDAVLLEVCADE
jgi:DNA polymerase-3 subunit delta'